MFDSELDYLRKRAVFYATWLTIPRIVARQYDEFRKTGKLYGDGDDPIIINSGFRSE
jgi:hypothetical protein